MDSMNVSSVMQIMNSVGGMDMDAMNDAMSGADMDNMTGNDVVNAMMEHASEMMNDNMMG